MVGMLVFIWYGMEILVFHQLALSGIALTASPKKDINKHMHMLPHLPPYTQTKNKMMNDLFETLKLSCGDSLPFRSCEIVRSQNLKTLF